MKTLARLVTIPFLLMFFSLQTAPAQDQAPAISDGEIRQLLAPIALYPDALLSQVLIAATYPLEVVEAARWSRNNPGLEGQAAVDAVESMDWDPSIKALVAFPDLLARMSEELAWTRRLGEAFLLQEEDVIAAIQDLRERAEVAGSLDGLEHARAYRSGDVIVIEPRDTRVVYVPYYSPRIVYGGWWWSAYPPYYWYPPPGYYTATGFWWGSGIVLSSGFFFSSFDWRLHHIVILRHHRHRFHYTDYPRWRHDPKHRRGVVYREPALARQFGRTSSGGTPSVSTTVQPRTSQPALRRHPGAFYSSGDRQIAGGDGRRSGTTTHLRPQRGSVTTDTAATGSRPSALQRSTGDRGQRSIQDSGAAPGVASGDTAPSAPASGLRGARTQAESAGPARSSRATGSQRATRDSRSSTRSRDASVSGQRSSFSSSSGSTRSTGTTRPSMSSGDSGRGSALRGTR
jgi:hypothetical protein